MLNAMKNTIPATSGIYRIQIGPRTFYWGQAFHLRKREASHRHRLRAGTHTNKHLQSAFDKYGQGAYRFEVSMLCPKDDLNLQEQFCLDIWCGSDGCANVGLVADRPTRGITSRERSAQELAERGAAVSRAHRRGHLCVRVRHLDGRDHTYDHKTAAAQALGVSATSISNWIKGIAPHPKHNIASIERVDKS